MKAKHNHSIWPGEKINSSSSRNNIVFEDLVKYNEMRLSIDEN
jgi:hypothetical protein